MEKEKILTKLEIFLGKMASMDEEEMSTELKKLSAVERANVKALEYIAADSYPPKHVDQKKILLTLRVKGRLYYPIVGWDPDSTVGANPALVPPMRRWLNSRVKHQYHSVVENRTYTLYD